MGRWRDISVAIALLAGAMLLLSACGAPMPVPTSSSAPTPSETGFDPTYTEVPTPYETGDPGELGDRAKVLVVVTYATWSPATGEILAFAFIPGITENGGVCTLVAVKGAIRLTAANPAEADATSTTCGQLALADSSLVGPGWKISISYNSTRSAGLSATQEIDIP